LQNTNDAKKNILTADNKGYNISSLASLGELSDAYGSILDYQDLITIYEGLVTTNPKIAQYHSSLAFLYKELGEYNKAKQEALNALQLSPESKQSVDEFLRTLPR
jgi:tetratricopeptide (TPR) repeat protein